MKIDKKIIVNALIALVVYAAVMGLVKGGVLSRQMMSLITPVCVYVMMSSGSRHWYSGPSSER